MWDFPVKFLLLPWALSWGAVLLTLGYQKQPEDRTILQANFERMWSIRGAITWLGVIFVAQAIFWGIRLLSGKVFSRELLQQQTLGYVLAYVFGFVIYRLFQLLVRNKR